MVACCAVTAGRARAEPRAGAPSPCGVLSQLLQQSPVDSCSSLPAPPPPSRGVCAGLGEWGGQLAMLRSYAGPSLPPHTPSATLHPSRFPSSDAQHRPCGSSYSSPGPGGWPIPALSLWPGGWWRSGRVTWVGLSPLGSGCPGQLRNKPAQGTGQEVVTPLGSSPPLAAGPWRASLLHLFSLKCWERSTRSTGGPGGIRPHCLSLCPKGSRPGTERAARK